jgi:hypothetical protein
MKNIPHPSGISGPPQLKRACKIKKRNPDKILSSITLWAIQIYPNCQIIDINILKNFSKSDKKRPSYINTQLIKDVILTAGLFSDKDTGWHRLCY